MCLCVTLLWGFLETTSPAHAPPLTRSFPATLAHLLHPPTPPHLHTSTQVRDTNARLGTREAFAVHDWVAAGDKYQYHVMRDHWQVRPS